MKRTRAEHEELLLRFAAAWSRRDVEDVIALMTDDCVYEASVGPGPGSVFVGRCAVREGIRAMFAHDDGSTAGIGGTFVADDRGAWEWTYTWPDGAGGGRSIRGCDLFEFEGGKIRRKNAFRKTFG